MVKNLIPWKKQKHEVEVLKPHDDPTFGLTRGLSEMVNQMFRRFDEHGVFSPSRKDFGFSEMPSIDIAETDDALTVSADIPGLEEKDVQVSLEERTLILRGERRHEHEDKKKNYHLIERSYGSFHRTISLPDGINHDDVKASFKNGVLKVRLGKVPGAKSSSRKIPVEAG
jgi:HSP20 family protein